MKYPIEAFHSAHRLYWHPICTLTSINEKCWPSVSQVFIAARTVTASQTLRSPGQPKNARKLNEGLQTARQSQANPCFKATWWWTFKKLTVYTVYPLATSPPCVRGEWGVKTCHENKNNSSSIFNIQIHTDKLLSKNIFMTFFSFFFFFFFTILVHNFVVFLWIQWW